ncbi:hypothetical protein SCOR_22625 [Sulfidibacter corallicola]
MQPNRIQSIFDVFTQPQAAQPTGLMPLSRCGGFELGDFESGARGRFRAPLFGSIDCRYTSCFDWLSKLLNLQALRRSHDAGTLDLKAFDGGREGIERLRSLAQLIAVAWVASTCRPSGFTAPAQPTATTPLSSDGDFEHLGYGRVWRIAWSTSLCRPVYGAARDHPRQVKLAVLKTRSRHPPRRWGPACTEPRR